MRWLVMVSLLLLSACGQQAEDPWLGYGEGDYALISAPQAGWLTDLTVERGQIIHRGDLLSTLDSTEQQAARDQARATLEQAQASLKQEEANLTYTKGELERQEGLTRDNVGTIQTRDQAENNYRQSQSRVAQLRAQISQMQASLGSADYTLSQRRVVALTQGPVEEVYFRPGEYVAASTAVVSAASGGSTSSPLSNLLTNSALGWSLAGNIVQTIFDGGALKGRLALSRGREQELIATYRQTVLSAFSDVETNLGQVSSLADQEQYRAAQSRSAAEAFRLAELQYRRGVADLLNVLTAQQAMFTAQDQLVQVRLSRLQADVGLYQALGGGWSESPELATQRIALLATPVLHRAAEEGDANLQLKSVRLEQR